ncbi:hypothetical protein [Halogranum rubrum]|uniref:Lipoprotein n=1 Tax=Halogranum salarium B-1 TaxID=1210908 RepID=J3ETQ9_9EURY|nr:hypothetical protein [Halogranum salarium]EJN57587.1 hypothetical protein HSB1_39480 [Halogranum salarium B-1]
MSRRALSILLLACLTLTAGCTFLGPNPDSYTSTYDYTVGIDANTTIQNATIRVPLPQTNGTTAVNASIVAPGGTVDGAFDAAVVETEYGPMLELTTDQLRVETQYYRIVEEGGQGRREEISREEYDSSNPNHQKVTFRTVSVDVSLQAEYPLDTRAPLGTEPTFYTDDAITRNATECQLPNRGESVCYTYGAPMYLAYDAPANASVEGIATFGGYNEWFTGGWTGNEYTDRVQFAATGPQNGWIAADGYTETGRGNYPSPEP